MYKTPQVDLNELAQYKLTKYGQVEVSQRNRGTAKGKRSKRIYVSKSQFYAQNELSVEQWQKLVKWQRDRDQGSTKKAPYFKDKGHKKFKRDFHSAGEVNHKHDELKGLIDNNFSGNPTREKFITLTWRKAFKVETVKGHVSKFEHQLSYAYKGIAYILIPEIGRDHSKVHYHILVRFPKAVSNTELQDFLDEKWGVAKRKGHGKAHVKSITEPAGLTDYLMPRFYRTEVTESEWVGELEANPQADVLEGLLDEATGTEKRKLKRRVKKERIKFLPHDLKLLKKTRNIKSPLVLTTKAKSITKFFDQAQFEGAKKTAIDYRRVDYETGEILTDTLEISRDFYHFNDRSKQLHLYNTARGTRKRQKEYLAKRRKNLREERKSVLESSTEPERGGAVSD